MMRRLVTWAGIVAGLWAINWFIATALTDYAYEIQVVMLIGINAIMAVSLNLINGITGQFSMGHAGFMAIGAYISAALTFYGDPVMTPWIGETLWFVVALVVGGCVAAIAGFCVGLPTLRLRGDYLAMATLGFGEIIRVVILNLDCVGGARGFTGIAERSTFFGVFLTLVITTWFIRNLMRSPRGKAFLAIREDEVAAAAIGINVTRYKVTAFVIGAFFAGIGGGFFAHFITYLHTNTFTFTKSFEYVAMVVLGGMGSLTGAIIAALLLTALPEVLRAANEYRMIVYALLLIVFMLLRREGLLGRREFSFAWLKRCLRLRSLT